MAGNQKLKFRQQKRRKKTLQNQQNPGWVQIFFKVISKDDKGVHTKDTHTQNDMNWTLSRLKYKTCWGLKLPRPKHQQQNKQTKKAWRTKNEKIAHDFEMAV